MNNEMITRIEDLLFKQESVVVAIDGMCAAGKTTLAKELKHRFHGEIIPMDAFFLPKELRTEERYQEPGGNIHYERFMQEILYPFLNNKPIHYRSYNCKKMKYKADKKVPVTTLYIVEGTYCMRTEFQKLYDLSIFLFCSKEEQNRRINNRNGEIQAEVFRKKWIPLENRYFKNKKIEKYCDIVENTGENI
jgi:uridine kinase